MGDNPNDTGDPETRAAEPDISGMAADLGEFADWLEASGVQTADELRAFVEEYPHISGRVADHMRTLFGDSEE